MVMSVTMIFRIPNETLTSETIKLLGRSADHEFYATALEILLVSTLVPIVAVMVMPSRVERAQNQIFTLAQKSAGTLERAATTEHARERIRIAVGKVALQRTISNSLTTLVADAREHVPTASAIFEQIDRRGEPTGSIRARELIAWWQSAEPPDKIEIDRDGKTQTTASYSRVPTARQILTTVGVEDIAADEMKDVLSCIMEECDFVFEERRHLSLNRAYYLNIRSRKTMWALPGVDEWLEELHVARQLHFPGSQPTSHKRVIAVGRVAPVSPRRSRIVQSTGGRVTRQQQVHGVANPVFQTAREPNEWEQRRSREHQRPYWVNKKTRKSQWERPADFM